tara:strand:- start:786 stop:1067 length:282 start_codon:yes stop_codon:yes gene_type:complete
MGKIKRLLDEENQSDFITDKELDEQFNEWKNSEQYAEMINNQFELHKSKYSDAELDNAIKYAFECIMLPMEEVGSDVYQKLWRQHFWEILNQE